VLAVAGGVTGTEDERLGTVGWPLGLVVEFRGIPDDLFGLVNEMSCQLALSYLQHKLWDLHWMRRWAVTGRQKVRRACSGVSDMVLMVGCIKVLPVPAATFC
jgi:hypothetical protein